MYSLSVFSPVASACGNLFVGVARPAHLVRGPSRSCAVGAVCACGVQFCFCIQQWTCCVTHMTRTPQWLKKIAVVIPAQFISLRMVAEVGFLF